jgi:DNA polymerase sigma
VIQVSEVKGLRMLETLHKGMEATHTFPGHSHIIGAARVPIIKGRLLTGQQVDLSHQPRNTPDLASLGVRLMRHFLSDLPQTKPLLLVFKALLKQQDLNTVRTDAVQTL